MACVSEPYMYMTERIPNQNTGNKISKIIELLNILKNVEIVILEWSDSCNIDFKNRSEFNVFNDVYDRGLIKFNNGSVIRFKNKDNFFNNNFISCLIQFEKLDDFCDELEKRIIGSN